MMYLTDLQHSKPLTSQESVLETDDGVGGYRHHLFQYVGGLTERPAANQVTT